MRRELSLIFSLALKDWQLFFADKRAALLCFAVPIVLASAFGMVFHRPADATSAPRLPVLIVLEDDAIFTQELVGEMMRSPRLEAELVNRATAEKRIADCRPGVAIFFPKGFSQLQTWKTNSKTPKPTIEIAFNPLCASEGQWAEGVASEVIMKKLARVKLAPVLSSDDTEKALAMPFAVASRTASHGHAGFNSYTHSFNGMTLQYLLFWGMESGLLLLRDRQRSVWMRLRSAPVPLWCVLLGKATSTAGIAMLIVGVTFSFGALVFGVSISGSFFGFLLIAAAVSALSAAMGLLVAAIGGTETRARSVCILAILSISMLGGLWLPSFVLPSWARDLALSLPTTWAMRGFDQVTWQGRGIGSAWSSILALVLFTALFLGFAVLKLISSEARRRRGIA